MKLTPLDIQQQTFKVVMRGYDRVEVTEFLEQLRRDYETALEANETLRHHLAEAKTDLSELRSREADLQSCLVAAREMASEIVERANKDAELIAKEAQLSAERLIQAADQKANDVKLELGDLKHQRSRLQAELRSVLEGHRSLLESADHDHNPYGNNGNSGVGNGLAG